MEGAKTRDRRRAIARYGFAAACIALATLARLAADPYLHAQHPYVTFYVAVVAVAWYADLAPAIATTIVGFLVGEWFFVEPRHVFPPVSVSFAVSQASYFMVTLSIVLFGHSLQKARKQLLLRNRELEREADERKKIEEALRGSEERLRYALETGRTGAWELDLMDRTAVRSVEHDRIFGYPDLLPQWTLEMFFEHVVPEDREMVQAKFHQAIQTQSDWSFECRIVRVDSAVRWIWAAGRHRPDASGAARWIAGIVQDITDRRQAERRLEELFQQAHQEIARREQVEAELRRSNEDLSQFAYVISHDLRSPLNAVTSFAQQLKEEYQDKLGQDAETYFNYLTGATDRMRRLISDLLVYSRTAVDGASEAAPMRLQEALEQAQLNLELKIRESGAEVTHGPLPEMPVSGRLAQVFQNLLENAIRFRTEAVPRIHVSASRAGKEWTICVSDNGIGIEPQHAGQVFRLFRRLQGDQYEGTGIGLAICKKIVERQGGRIWVESKRGEGARFYFTLPASGALA